MLCEPDKFLTNHLQNSDLMGQRTLFAVMLTFPDVYVNSRALVLNTILLSELGKSNLKW